MPERITKENIEKWKGLPPVTSKGRAITPEELIKLAEYIKSIFTVEEENTEEADPKAEISQKED